MGDNNPDEIPSDVQTPEEAPENKVDSSSPETEESKDSSPIEEHVDLDLDQEEINGPEEDTVGAEATLSEPQQEVTQSDVRSMEDLTETKSDDEPAQRDAQTSPIDNSSEDFGPAEPFEPWYKVQIIDASKNGENIIFKLNTIRLEAEAKAMTVERVYEDFEWLNHCITTQNDIGGIIVPPLPPKPVATAADAAAKSRKELGGDSKKLKGDEFERDSRCLERYLQSVIKHRLLGRDLTLAKFLTETDPPIKARLKKSIFDNFAKAIEGAWKAGNQDVDDTFMKHRQHASNTVQISRDMSTHFNAMVNHSQRLGGALTHFSTALCLVSSAKPDSDTAKLNELQLSFARAIEHCSKAAEIYSTNDANTLGFTLDLYSRYALSVKEMLHRRTVKLYEFDSSVKALEKAKNNPKKKPAAEELRNQREKDFQEISKVAKREIEQYQRQRVFDFQKVLVLYAEAKIKTARDIYAVLAKDLNSLKQVDMEGS